MPPSPLRVHLAHFPPPGASPVPAMLDVARWLRERLKSRGVRVTQARRRLREDACNVVLGPGPGGASTPRHACVRVDATGLAGDGPRLHFGPTASLSDTGTTPLEARALTLLSLAPDTGVARRVFERLAAAGLTVVRRDPPRSGAERDYLVGEARAVLEIVEDGAVPPLGAAPAFHVLSLGTPVVRVRSHGPAVPDAGDRTIDGASDARDGVLVVPERDLDAWARTVFPGHTFLEDARATRARWRREATGAVADAAFDRLLAFLDTVQREHAATRPPGPWRPRALHAGAGTRTLDDAADDDALHVAASDRDEPDVVLDLARAPLATTLDAPTAGGGRVRLEAGQLLRLRVAPDADGRAPALTSTLLHNARRLLAPGGHLELVRPPHEDVAWLAPPGGPAAPDGFEHWAWRRDADALHVRLRRAGGEAHAAITVDGSGTPWGIPMRTLNGDAGTR